MFSQSVPKLLLLISQISQLPPPPPTPHTCPPFQPICFSLKYSVLFHMQVLCRYLRPSCFSSSVFYPVFKWTSNAASSLEVGAGTSRLFESQSKSVIRAQRFQPLMLEREHTKARNNYWESELVSPNHRVPTGYSSLSWFRPANLWAHHTDSICLLRNMKMRRCIWFITFLQHLFNTGCVSELVFISFIFTSLT